MAWVRQLAGALARDEIAADDVAQEAWLVASERAPDDNLPLRPWLARVVHNLVRMRRRSSMRRELRERAAIASSAEPTPHDLLERVEAQRAIADEVIALAEPYRKTVLLHYVEGVSTSTIARRLDIPAGTVRRRLKVARDRLRERLRGDRVALVLLLALARSRTARATPLALGAVMMKKTIALVGLIVLLLLGGAAVHHLRSAPSANPSVDVSIPMLVAGIRARAATTTLAPARPIAPRHVAGRVVVAGGVPVANAIVRLGYALFPYDDSELDPIAVARSDANGNFDFGTRSFAAAVVTAEAPERAVARLRVDEAPATDRLVLELGECATHVIGVVRDVVGGPIEGARIATLGLGGVDSARDGSFSVCMRAGGGRVRVEADGYGTVGFAVTVAGRVHHDVVLVPEGVLVGIVVDEAGHAVPGARVAAFQVSTDAADRWTIADSDGRFRVARLTPGHYRLAATSNGLGTRIDQLVVVETSSANRELRLVVSARARVAGHVVLDGAPIAGARITVDLVRGRGEHDDTDAYAVSGLDGSFTLDGVPLGAIALVVAPYRVRAPRMLVVDRLALANVVLDVTRIGSLHGRVTRDGAPVADAEVECGSPSVFSDASGTYALNGLDGSKCRLLASAHGATSVPADIALTGEPQVADIDLSSSATIRGIVVGATGARVPDVLVVARAIASPTDLCTAMTDAAGEFACTGLRGGDYELAAFPGPGTRAFARAPNASHDQTHVDAGTDARVTVAVQIEFLAIRGSVVDDTGSPVADAFVEAFTSSSPTNIASFGEPAPTARTDSSGEFSIDRLGTGTYNLRARAADGGEVTTSGIAAGSSGVELRVSRAGSISGTLVGFATPPLVTFSGVGGASEATVDGSSFAAVGLVPGTYWLEAYDSANDSEADSATVVVAPNNAATAILRDRARGTVEATVVDATTHAPVAGLACHVAAVADNNIGCCSWLLYGPTSLSDLQGHARLDAPAGAVRVFCMPSLQPPFPADSPFSWATGDATVPAGGTGFAEVLAAPRVYPRSDVGFYTSNFTGSATIISIDPSGPAATSGLVVGDVVLALDGNSVTALSPNAVLTLATNHRPGSTLAVGTARGTFTILVAANSF